MTTNHVGLIKKCKNLRRMLQGRRVNGNNILGSFSLITEGMKYSGLFRKLSREARDALYPRPPSYFTISLDGKIGFWSPHLKCS
jgi:hypothetical protein